MAFFTPTCPVSSRVVARHIFEGTCCGITNVWMRSGKLFSESGNCRLRISADLPQGFDRMQTDSPVFVFQNLGEVWDCLTRALSGKTPNPWMKYRDGTIIGNSLVGALPDA